MIMELLAIRSLWGIGSPLDPKCCGMEEVSSSCCACAQLPHQRLAWQCGGPACVSSRNPGRACRGRCCGRVPQRAGVQRPGLCHRQARLAHASANHPTDHATIFTVLGPAPCMISRPRPLHWRKHLLHACMHACMQGLGGDCWALGTICRAVQRPPRLRLTVHMQCPARRAAGPAKRDPDAAHRRLHGGGAGGHWPRGRRVSHPLRQPRHQHRRRQLPAGAAPHACNGPSLPLAWCADCRAVLHACCALQTGRKTHACMHALEYMFWGLRAPLPAAPGCACDLNDGTEARSGTVTCLRRWTSHRRRAATAF